MNSVIIKNFANHGGLYKSGINLHVTERVANMVWQVYLLISSLYYNV